MSTVMIVGCGSSGLAQAIAGMAGVAKVVIVGVDYGKEESATYLTGACNLSEVCIVDEIPQPKIKPMMFEIRKGEDFDVKALSSLIREKDYPTLKQGIRRNQIRRFSK